MKSYSAHKDGAAQFQPRRRKQSLGIGLAALMVCVLTTAQAQTASEYQIKAAYLYNFAKYAEWPEQTLPKATSPIVIGVFSGDDEFLDQIKKAVEGKNAGMHPIFVRRVSSIEEMRLCQVLFLRSSVGHKRTENTVAALALASVLLVGESDDFLGMGGMINLLVKDGTVHFEINREALDRARIRLATTLMAAAVGQGGSAEDPAPASTAASGESRRLKVSTPPEYPEIAKRMNIRGAVQLELTVRRDGTVKDVKIIGGHPILAESLAKAVRGWQYEPAAKESQVVVKIIFGQ